MKRIILTALAVCTVALGQVFGQSISTAYELSDFQREGTARSVAMGNAMTALGGDMGAISINPAASAGLFLCLLILQYAAEVLTAFRSISVYSP